MDVDVRQILCVEKDGVRRRSEIRMQILRRFPVAQDVNRDGAVFSGRELYGAERDDVRSGVDLQPGRREIARSHRASTGYGQVEAKNLLAESLRLAVRVHVIQPGRRKGLIDREVAVFAEHRVNVEELLEVVADDDDVQQLRHVDIVVRERRRIGRRRHPNVELAAQLVPAGASGTQYAFAFATPL